MVDAVTAVAPVTLTVGVVALTVVLAVAVVAARAVNMSGTMVDGEKCRADSLVSSINGAIKSLK